MKLSGDKSQYGQDDIDPKLGRKTNLQQNCQWRQKNGTNDKEDIIAREMAKPLRHLTKKFRKTGKVDIDIDVGHKSYFITMRGNIRNPKPRRPGLALCYI